LESAGHSRVGETVSHYRILRKLGAGGMGEVYQAVDVDLDRPVVLKFLLPHLWDDERTRERFVREARAASSLDHPNICTIYEIGRGPGEDPFIAMAYYEGETLAQRIEREGALPFELLIDIARQLAAGLAIAHQRGVIHRDVKPHNVMLPSDGVAKILDFGVAKLREAPNLTATNSAVGTLLYMSPEQCEGRAVDERSDIWSLGAVLYEMTTGERAFGGENIFAAAYEIAHQDPPTVDQLRPDVPAELNSIIERALEKDPDARYQTMRELEAELGAIQSLAQPAAPPATASSKRSIWPWTSARPPTQLRRNVLVALALLLAGAGAFWAARWGISRPGVAANADAPIHSVAILPLRSLNQQTVDSHLGLGIADALITKVGQVGKVRVSPISAVLAYDANGTDSIEAARQLSVDSVLDGSIQQSGERVRVSVQLLRTSDGATLWAESFDTRSADLFALQDDVAGKVMERLAVRLSVEQRSRIRKRQTSSPEAFEYYSKAMYHLVNRGFFPEEREESDLAIDLLREAIARDPGYALAHAQLGYAYAWTAVALEHNPGLIEQANQELAIAERLDRELPEVHAARSLVLWSQYARWNVDAAIRELRLAQQLNPNVGNTELATLFSHTGLVDLWVKYRDRALALDPNSETNRRVFVAESFILLRVDEGVVMEKNLMHRGPRTDYYLRKKMFEQAAQVAESNYRNDPQSLWNRMNRTATLIFQGQRDTALAELNSLAQELETADRNSYYHHWTYRLVQGYASLGKAAEAYHWLQETVNEGFPCYPVFEQDWMLDAVRNNPAIAQLLAEVKERWEARRREFEPSA
jgi:eukaryotic-like serine/threonine-protein kinase